MQNLSGQKQPEKHEKQKDPRPFQKRMLIIYTLAVFLITLLFAIPLRLLNLELFAPNTTPSVVPILREWHGAYGYFTLDASSHIIIDPLYASQLRDTAGVFQSDLRIVSGRTLPIITVPGRGSGDFFLTLRNADSGLGSEGYLFQVTNSVTISAHTSTGIFYGTRTALQILQQDYAQSHIPRGTARDYPSYAERGFMLDVGRKFFSITALEDYVRFMAWYKMNDFHLHFNDNEMHVNNDPNWMHKYAAFRLNSPRFPGLAAKDGSYSEQDIRALELVAQQYNVAITPEIDAPAHALAFTQYRPDLVNQQASKEFLDLSNPGTYTFLNAIWNEFLPWFTSPQIDIGADEYSPADAGSYRQFINTYDAFMRQRGKTVRMWGSLSEIKSSIKVNTDIVIDVWDNTWSNPRDMVNQGFHIINMDDNLLYIVPKAGYFNDYLDTQFLYEKWEPNIFSLINPSLDLQPGDPHLLGGMFAEWNDRLGTVVSDLDVYERVKPAMRTVSEKLWTGPTRTISYEQFEQMALQSGEAPGTHLPLLSPSAIPAQP